MNSKPIVDHFGRVHDYLRISLTDKCNFRCHYCMPANITFMPNKKLLTASEIFRLAKTFVNMGVKKIRLTGGEPLVRNDFPQILDRLGTLPVKLAITTNGYLLDKYLDSMEMNGLRSVNISLDTLRRERFLSITQRDFFDRCTTNISLALNKGFDVKINMVVIKDSNDDEILDFVRWSVNNTHVRFIEFMPFYQNKWDFSKTIGLEEIMNRIRKEFVFEEMPSQDHDTAKNFRVQGGKGTFGIISTVTSPFCQGCNRIRLTADGKIKNCLFDTNELDILTPLRQGESIEPLIKSYFLKKKESLGGLKKFTDPDAKEEYEKNRWMVAIGG